MAIFFSLPSLPLTLFCAKRRPYFESNNSLIWLRVCVFVWMMCELLNVWGLSEHLLVDILRRVCVCSLDRAYCLCTIAHSAEMMMFWLQGLSTQPGCNIVWLYQQCCLMGEQAKWRPAVLTFRSLRKPGLGLHCCQATCWQSVGQLSFSGDLPCGGRPSLLQR